MSKIVAAVCAMACWGHERCRGVSRGAAEHQEVGLAIGSAAAKAGPLCDPATGKVHLPTFTRRVRDAVAQGRGQRREHGAGVTATTVKVVSYMPNEDQIRVAQTPPPKNRATGGTGTFEQAILDVQKMIDGRLRVVRAQRRVELRHLDGVRRGVAAADALKVVAMRPFVVVTSAGDTTFITEVAAKKIVVTYGSEGTNHEAIAQTPYRGPARTATSRPRTSRASSASRSQTRRAQWAGDDALKGQQRTFRARVQHVERSR